MICRTTEGAHQYHTSGHCYNCGDYNNEADVRDQYDFFDMGDYKELLGVRRPPSILEISTEVVDSIVSKLIKIDKEFLKENS